ncbi:MAG TPA: adenylate/guanylate cyclase domain-containing protein [Nocardioidaceae bacterium]|nr:adenylate/guanylate cyclase domain-containing protein [Nocardioidaceae bacterium]
MRFWDVSGPEVEAADAEPWDMPLAKVMRPFATRSLVNLVLAGSLLFSLSGLSGLLLATGTRSVAADGSDWVAFHVLATLTGVSMVLFVLALPVRVVRRAAPTYTLALLTYTAVAVTWGVASAGPSLAFAVVAYIQGPLFAFYMLRLPWAVADAALVLGCFAWVLAVQDGWESPVETWLFLAANVIGTGVVMGLIGARADALAASERGAKLVLRRFLSKQVADHVLTGESTELAKPHRARIAVFFCDLRGFTAFTNHAEPEEVVDVLDQYYRAVGGLLQRYDATVGDYAGDGIMAYFGDPVPRDDAAAAAVEMAREVTVVMAGVVADWQHRGYDLHFGVGVAYGYATLGVVGFDGRFDYKPVGGVMNLAARLCAKAEAGQVLLDQATYAATYERFPSTHVADLELKGYAGEVRAYSLGR